MQVTNSINGVPIRLTDERWVHIVENHDDLAGKLELVLETIVDPDLLLAGTAGELLAVRYATPHAIIAVYREISASDGFVITAFQTSRVQQLVKSRKILWNKQQSKKHSK